MSKDTKFWIFILCLSLFFILCQMLGIESYVVEFIQFLVWIILFSLPLGMIIFMISSASNIFPDK